MKYYRTYQLRKVLLRYEIWTSYMKIIIDILLRYQPLLDEHISQIINIIDDDTKVLKYPVPNGKMKKSENYVSQDVFPRNWPQTMTRIKKHKHTEIRNCMGASDMVLQVNCVRHWINKILHTILGNVPFEIPITNVYVCFSAPWISHFPKNLYSALALKKS